MEWTGMDHRPHFLPHCSICMEQVAGLSPGRVEEDGRGVFKTDCVYYLPSLF